MPGIVHLLACTGSCAAGQVDWLVEWKYKTKTLETQQIRQNLTLFEFMLGCCNVSLGQIINDVINNPE